MSRRLVIEADGGSRGNPGPAGYGAAVRDADTGEILAEVAAAIGIATNNVAEYGGLIAGLRAAAELDAGAELTVRMDSKLVVEQMSGRWQVKHETLRPLAREAASLVRRFPQVSFGWIPREQNRIADRLANEAMDDAAAGREWVRREQRPTVPQPEGEGTTNRLSGWMDAPTPPTTTFLLRHGQTAHNIDRRFSGGNDNPLTDLGREQAAAAARRLAVLARIEVVVASPLTRARETAQIVAAALGLPVETEDGLRETDFGQWEGHTFSEVKERWPAELADWLADPATAPPDGESFAATERRVRKARDAVLTRHHGKVALLVSHVTPIKTLARLAVQAPPAALYRLHVDSASLTEIDWHADGPAVLRRFNDTAHLEQL
ncbi:MAG: ribonuclease / adenosylcobalamin/alpha-ribazole phosphatase [Frankiales bacterium]|nr:ribonuclease / adenosylcobalamin/alpha-ribazole phosphatase [Frankiales bacterium]